MTRTVSVRGLVDEALRLARRRWGNRDGWWPGDDGLEIAIGAVLVQNAAWRNAERALDALRAAALFDLDRLRRTSIRDLERLIRPAGTYRRKARTILALAEWFAARGGASIEARLGGAVREVRASLLGVPGIGPETAAAIMLYAGGHPVFVADAFAKRILVRHGLIDASAAPGDVAAWFEAATPPDSKLLAELHAHVVSTGQGHCRPRVARCDDCPFSAWPLPVSPFPDSDPASGRAGDARRSSPGSSSPP